jgi:hypothetical protein
MLDVRLRQYDDMTGRDVRRRASPAAVCLPGGVGDIKQFLVEAADPAIPVDQVDFEDPVADAAGAVDAAHRLAGPGHDVVPGLVTSNLLVGN